MSKGELMGGDLEPPVAAGDPGVTDRGFVAGTTGTGFKDRVARGIRWRLFGQISDQALAIGVGIALAHLLTPREFGLAGMAVVFTGLGAIFGDLAFSASLIQKPTLREEDRSTAFWTNVGAGALLTALGVAISPLVADFYSRPAVGPLFAASSTLFIVWALSGTQTAILTRDMNFRSLELRAIGAGAVGGIAAVVLALSGAGAYAIIGELVVSAVVSLILLWKASPWRPHLIYSFESFRTLGAFGGKTLVSQFLAYLVLNMDNLLVGRFLGSAALGVYSIAYTMMYLPIGRIVQPISQVMFSALARIQHDPERLRATWLRGNELVSAVNVPAFLGMAVVAPDFVKVVLGQRWHGAVPVLQLLCLAGAADTLHAMNWSATQAIGKAGVMLRLRAMSTPLMIAAFALGLRWGVVGVAGLFAAARLIFLAASTVITCRELQYQISAAVRAYAAVLQPALVMGVSCYVARIGLMQAGIPVAARLLMLVVLGVATYSALALWWIPALAREILTYLPLGRKRNHLA